MIRKLKCYVESLRQNIVRWKDKDRMTEVIYYDPFIDGTEQSNFRDGEAWLVNPDPASPADENFGILKISASTYEGLFFLGIIEQLQALPHDYLLGAYEEGILYPEALPRAADILERTADSIGNELRDVLCLTQTQPKRVEYRMKIQPGHLREGLRELAMFCRGASLKGYGVQLWL